MAKFFCVKLILWVFFNSFQTYENQRIWRHFDAFLVDLISRKS